MSGYQAAKRCVGGALAGSAGELARKWRLGLLLLAAAAAFAAGPACLYGGGYGGGAEAFAQEGGLMEGGLADAGRPEVPSSKVQCLTMVSPRYPLPALGAGSGAGKQSGLGKEPGAGKDLGAATAVPVAVPDTVPVTVTLRVAISKAGTVMPVRLVAGDKAFAAEAMDAVRLWRYRPYVRDGEAIEVATDVRVEFVPGRPAGMVSHPVR